MKKKEMEKGSNGWGSWTAGEEAVGLKLGANALQITEDDWRMCTHI